MTDPALVAKKLAFIETCVAELRAHAGIPFAVDVVRRRFVLHTLQIAIQAALDVASHIVSDERLGEPQTNRELFDLLVRAGRIRADLGARLRAMAGFRNVVVHGYQEVDDAVVDDILANHLGDLLDFASEVRPAG